MATKLLFTGFFVAALALLAVPAWAAKGIVTDVNPPAKHGTITRTDDGSNDEYEFNIPGSLADPGYAPQEGHEVDFDTDPEPSRNATGVSLSDDPATVDLCPVGQLSGCPFVHFTGEDVAITDSQVKTILLSPEEWNVLVDKVFGGELPPI